MIAPFPLFKIVVIYIIILVIYTKMSIKKALRQWHIFRGRVHDEYRLRWDVSLPCSGWERVGPPRSNHRKAIENFIIYVS